MKVFDEERAERLKKECAQILGNEDFICSAVEKDSDPCLRVEIGNVTLHFKCYKYS